MSDSEHDAPLPDEQSSRFGPPLPPRVLHRRRETIFLGLAGLFLGSLTMLNILGITRFLDLSLEIPGVGTIPMPLAVGVLPYPITFLCTDLISEFYGRRRANTVVGMGLILNLWVVLILWLGAQLPGVAGEAGPKAPGENLHALGYFWLRDLAFGAVMASMAAYLAAQFVDVQLYHFWKKRTRGRHLWLRNNGSTLASQLVDAVAVILVTHFLSHALPIDRAAPLWPQLFTFMAASYSFKMVTALLDTGPFYLAVYILSRYLRLPARDLAQE